MMKIHPDSGAIEFPMGVIGPATDLAQFLNSAIGRSSQRTLTNEQWQHFAIDPEPELAGTVIFKGDSIWMVLVAMRMPSDSGNEWSESTEQERKDRHDAWLRAQLGEPPYEYGWGRVGSEYDSKGCASEIIVAYDC